MVNFMDWWVWMSFALILVTLEVLLPMFIFLGFTLGALATGLLLLVGVPITSVTALFVIFAVLSLIAYIGMRYFFGLPKGQVKIWDRDIND